jgi:hypothetical protein
MPRALMHSTRAPTSQNACDTGKNEWRASQYESDGPVESKSLDDAIPNVSRYSEDGACLLTSGRKS